MSDFLIPPFVEGPKNNLTPLFDKIISEIFRKFDKDGDSTLNSQELNDFAIATNGEPFDQESLKSVFAHIEVTESGNVTLKGFKQMYACQCVADPEESWKDFSKHGYSRDYILKCIVSKTPVIPKSKHPKNKLSKK